jgi:betaine reductase
MDLATQERVLDLAGQDSTDLVVLLGSPDPESAELSALTVTEGDPTFAGPLAGVQLGLPVYHILEPEVEASAEAGAYQEHVALMQDVLDRGQIVAAMQRVRGGS